MIDLSCDNCFQISVFDESMLNCPGCGHCYPSDPKSYQDQLTDLKTHVEVLEHMYTEHTRHVETQIATFVTEIEKLNKFLLDHMELGVENDDERQVH